MTDPRDARPSTTHHQQPSETSMASTSDAKPVASYHGALARHLSSLIRSATALSRSLTPVLGQTQRARTTTDADVDAPSSQAGALSSSSVVGFKKQDANSSESVSTSVDASTSVGNLRVDQMQVLPQAVAPSSQTLGTVVGAPPAPPPAPHYTNLELLAQRDAEHRKAWFLVGHRKYVGGVDQGFQLKMKPSVSVGQEAQGDAQDKEDGFVGSLVARRRKRKSVMEASSSSSLGLGPVAMSVGTDTTSSFQRSDILSGDSVDSSPQRKRARTMSEQGMPRAKMTILERRRVSGGSNEMSLSFAGPLQSSAGGKLPMQAEDEEMQTPKQTNPKRPTFINLPPAWSATKPAPQFADPVPGPSQPIPTVRTPQPHAVASSESPSPAKPWEAVPGKLYRKPSFKLQQPPLARTRHGPAPMTAIVTATAVTPVATPMEGTPARVNAHLQSHASDSEPIGMSGSSVASLSGVSVACPSASASTSSQAAKPTVKAEGLNANDAAFPLRPAPMLRGLSIGFSPAITPDRSSLLGILGVGVGSAEEVDMDDMEPAVEVTSDEKSEKIEAVSAAHAAAELTPYNDPMMLGRRIEDEWWANYVDFGDGEPVSGMLGK